MAQLGHEALKNSFVCTLIIVKKIICLSEASYDFLHYIIGQKVLGL